MDLAEGIQRNRETIEEMQVSPLPLRVHLKRRLRELRKISCHAHAFVAGKITRNMRAVASIVSRLL